MNKEFLPYEQALALKELGFDEPCLAIYDNITDENDKDDSDRFFYIRTEGWPKELFDRVTPVPLFSQAFRWFRDKYDLYPSINIYNDKWLCLIKSTVQSEIEVSGYIVATINNGHPTFDNYPEAELACLEKLIEIVEFKKEK
jgi:hypothetical protein